MPEKPFSQGFYLHFSLALLLLLSNRSTPKTAQRKAQGGLMRSTPAHQQG